MKSSNVLKEWSSRDKLPQAFSEWMKEVLREMEFEQGKAFSWFAEDLGVPPSILSRWISGWGPLNQYDIHILVSKLGPVVYTYLHIPSPD